VIRSTIDVFKQSCKRKARCLGRGVVVFAEVEVFLGGEGCEGVKQASSRHSSRHSSKV